MEIVYSQVWWIINTIFLFIVIGNFIIILISEAFNTVKVNKELNKYRQRSKFIIESLLI